MSTVESDHQLATYHVHTGYQKRAGGVAFPSARVWFETDDDLDLPACVREQRTQWRARLPMLPAIGAKSPVGPAAVAAVRHPLRLGRAAARRAVRRPTIDPARLAVRVYISRYMSRCPHL